MLIKNQLIADKRKLAPDHYVSLASAFFANWLGFRPCMPLNDYRFSAGLARSDGSTLNCHGNHPLSLGLTQIKGIKLSGGQ